MEMMPRVCMCCGESFAQKGNAQSHNPNMCANCQHLADGFGDPDMARPAELLLEWPLVGEGAEDIRKAA
jgi:hypothetical protein